MNNEDFVSYEIAQALKKAGFDWKCRAFYWTDDSLFEETKHDVFNNPYSNCTTMVAAPTLAQAHKWLRVQMGMDVYVIPRWQNAYEVVARELGKRPADTRLLFNLWDYAKPYDTYESALSAGITAALEILTDQAPANQNSK